MEPGWVATVERRWWIHAPEEGVDQRGQEKDRHKPALGVFSGKEIIAVRYHTERKYKEREDKKVEKDTARHIPGKVVQKFSHYIIEWFVVYKCKIGIMECWNIEITHISIDHII